MSQRPEIHRNVKFKKKKGERKNKVSSVNLFNLSRLLNAVMQMLFPFCKPFRLWLVRAGAVQQRNCTSLFCTSATALSHRWSNITARDSHACEETGLFSDCRITYGYRDWLKDGDLGILIRASTDFNQQRSDEMTEALIIAQVTAAHYESQFQLFKATSYAPLPHVQIPEVFLFWLPKDIGFLFVCLFVGHDVSMTFLKQSVQWASQSWKTSV